MARVKKSASKPKKSVRAAAPTPVEAIRHRDKRANIPTQELRDFVREDEAAPGTLLYPRDPSLDPQLVWKGKDEQDRHPLEVPLVPVYIQEKIHPQALIENLRDTAAAGEPEPEQLLFNDFNGIEFEDLIDFYQHEQNWANRMILGDSLLVMSSLAEKEGLKGKVQMIYLDPPYGIKFGSNWQVSTRKRDVKDGKVEDATRQPEQVRAFRDTWKLGIHSYLAYLRDRLIAARELLTTSGSIFVQIGDENIHLARSLLDEVFGSENFCSEIVFRKTMGAGSPMGGTDVIASVADYIIWYAKRKGDVRYRQLYEPRVGEDWVNYDFVRLPDGTHRKMRKEERNNWKSLPNGASVYRRDNLTSTSSTGDAAKPYRFGDDSYSPLPGGWKTSAVGMDRLVAANRLESYGKTLSYRRFADDFPWFRLTNLWSDTATGGYGETKSYVVQTIGKVMQRCLLMTTDPGDLVLDPTCGSGTTAFVAEQWGRRWITIDTSRVALALARTRLMCAKYPYYLLADSPEGVAKEAEVTGKMPPGYRTEGDIRKGFVYKRVPHVTLKSIANNPEIREGMSREEIDRAIAKYADTEVLYDQPYEDGKRIRVTGPFTVESLSPHRVLSDDESAPRTEREGQATLTGGKFEVMILDNLKKAGVQNTKKNERLVFDRLEPFAGEWLQGAGEYTESGGKVRRVAVCIGPEHGTVGPELVKEAAKEALKGVGFDLLVVCGFAFDAHADETAKEFAPDAGDTPAPQRERERTREHKNSPFEGGQGGCSRERERTREHKNSPFEGGQGGCSRERERTREQDPGSGFVVAEESRQYGKLPILLARMNPDLAMGDELLKKTGAGNLFMVFGEPDITIKTDAKGMVTVEIHGLDVYDPTTGVLRSDSTDDIACWFIDTDYNGESFFVRHAYFTGAGDPYDRLKRALRAEIDEAAWATLYTTKSRPFERPKSGRIAVKVINHYGDEVLKVYELAAT